MPPLAQLAAEDQVFVAAFVRSHGSIKEMEQVFGVSYPTIKARLNRIAAQLEFVETDPKPSRNEVLGRLERGEISAADAIRRIGGKIENRDLLKAVCSGRGRRRAAERWSRIRVWPMGAGLFQVLRQLLRQWLGLR